MRLSKLYPLILLVISIVTHFAFFGWPPQVVFDEYYNGPFAANYETGEFYFDVHPPLGKMLMHFFGTIIGTSYDADFSAIGNNLPWGIILLRLLPMIAGTLLPLVIYYISKHLNFSNFTAFAAGLLVIFENSLLVQSRFILFDSIMLLFGFLALLVYFMYVKRGLKWLLILSAVLAAGAFSIKWTGFAYPLLIVIIEYLRARNVRQTFRFTAVYAVIGLIFYLSVFAVHFAYLTKTGPGDAFMTDRFQKTLEGNPHQADPVVPKKFFGKTIELNLTMFEANKTLTEPHQYSSEWWTWPIMLRPIFYWQGIHVGTNEYIYLLGNPLIYWLGTFSVIVWGLTLLKKPRDPILLFIILGFLVNFIPFIFIGRVMFLYHYQAALVFSILAIAYGLEKVKEGNRKYATIVLLCSAFALFLFFSPLTYGFTLADEVLKAHMWLPSWR